MTNDAQFALSLGERAIDAGWKWDLARGTIPWGSRFSIGWKDDIDFSLLTPDFRFACSRGDLLEQVRKLYSQPELYVYTGNNKNCVVFVPNAENPYVCHVKKRLPTEFPFITNPYDEAIFESEALVVAMELKFKEK